MTGTDTGKKALTEGFAAKFGSSEGVRFFSAPGRSELGGNHTDHNCGMVLAAAIKLEAAAAARTNASGKVRLYSSGWDDAYEIDLHDLSPRRAEAATSSALIRGVAEGIRKEGKTIGGFDAYVVSSVLPGSGLSSSAAFEVLVGTIFNHLYCDGSIDPVKIAQIAQYAENVHFGKPCGLMDQLASSVGGILAIDFRDPQRPLIEKISYEGGPWNLVLVNTGGSHANLTPDYVAIRDEMACVAGYFGEKVLAEIKEPAFWNSLPELRAHCGDRAVLRAIHFMEENQRVQAMTRVLARGDLEAFHKIVRESGNSSLRFLQNGWSEHDVRSQGIMVGIAASESFLAERGWRGTCRVHGGGFAGTIQAWIHQDDLNAYCNWMNGVFGEGASIPVKIRNEGAIEF